FTASDGDNLAMQDWPLPEGAAQRGTVIIVHGLGEHAGRYDHVARRLNEWGFAVRGYDHYGHGDSGGVRGALPVESRLIDDLGDVVESTRQRMSAGLPLPVIAHAPQWSVPTLLMFAGEDKLVSPAGSRAFAEAAPPDVVTTHCFEQCYHEIFNEPDSEKVFAKFKRWIDANFGA